MTVAEIMILPTDPAAHAPTVQRWLADPHATFWGMEDLDVSQVEAYLRAIDADPHQRAWTGHVDTSPTFFAETYDPARVLLTGVHAAEPGDLGMHVLIAPPTREHRPGLTDAVFSAVMRWCFDELGARRVVVEPDVRNTRIAEKNRRAGFRVLREVELYDGAHLKRAALSICTRDDFAASELGGRA